MLLFDNTLLAMHDPNVIVDLEAHPRVPKIEVNGHQSVRIDRATIFVPLSPHMKQNNSITITRAKPNKIKSQSQAQIVDPAGAQEP